MPNFSWVPANMLTISVRRVLASSPSARNSSRLKVAVGIYRYPPVRYVSDVRRHAGMPAAIRGAPFAAPRHRVRSEVDAVAGGDMQLVFQSLELRRVRDTKVGLHVRRAACLHELCNRPLAFV